MSKNKVDQIIRTWKDEAYRRSLSEGEQAQLPANPAGLIELTDLELASVAGGTKPLTIQYPYCTGNCTGNCI